MSRLIYISGPSGTAKTSIKNKLESLAGPLGIQFERVIVTTSRDIRPNESQGNPWYFKSASEIDADHRKDPERFLMVEVRRGEPQGLDAETELRKKLETAGALWCELHATWFPEIKKWLQAHLPDTKITKVFVAPLTEAEVLGRMTAERATWEKVIEAEVLRRLVARRVANLDNASLEKLQERAQDAIKQYALRRQYDCIIINHQGEESPEWGAAAEFPTGEAANVVQQFLRIYDA